MATTKQNFLRHVTERIARIPKTEKTEALKDIAEIRRHYAITYAEIGDTAEALVDKFKNELEALSGIVKISNSPEETFQHLLELLKETNAKKIISWSDPTLKAYPIKNLGQYGYELMTSEDSTVAYKLFAKDADTGITGAKYAVAETGSIVLEAGIGKERSISLMPNLHIAIVKTSQFVKHTSQVFIDLANSNALPSSVNFITGPSRSADIEMDLSIGVHGPSKIAVIIEKD
ncbi:hypothetical protein BHU72_01125 [Desulfuribacillus stibiiarsenatis]|uniref:LUD domain-containing protein n=1 Tax=Desulfuribacillus stibiiarsenatis TaxID=1390249 RepID=A0A1E5L9S4_9FIRM|nr:lactate utilization protein C [Desulfuribacillus stibiiarsenatis]OEH86895.1 hypothetical protein BHU72_01125 [Desulfuribacillus stibiiarsenatis]